MSYTVVIDGAERTHRVRRGPLPQRGEWLGLEIGPSWCWLPVLEVGHILSRAEKLAEGEDGGDVLHEEVQRLVYCSLALGVKVERRSKFDAYKLLLPPTRWPFGGLEEDDDLEGLLKAKQNGSSDHGREEDHESK